MSRSYFRAAGFVLSFGMAVLAGCAGSGSTPPFAAGADWRGSTFESLSGTHNVVQNGSFDTGKLAPWTSCGTAAVSVSREHPYNGRYDAHLGSTSTASENKGWSAICQEVTVPAGATLGAWFYRRTNETSEKYAYTEVALADAQGKPAVELAKGNANAAKWVKATWSLKKYAGKHVTLFFGVYGTGRPRYYDMEFVDGVSLTGSATPTPSPSPTPTIGVNPASLTFASATAAPQTFAASESGYSGSFTSKSSNTSVATVGPNSAKGPNATFTVTPVAGGDATITIKDSSGTTNVVPVYVNDAVIIINGSRIKRSRGGAN